MAIHLISGKDSFRAQLQLEALKQELLGNDINDFNFCSANKPELKDFISLIAAPAFGFMNKIIVVKDFSFLENKSNNDEVQTIIKALKNKPKENIVVFLSEKIIGTLKLVKAIKKDFKDSLKEHDANSFSAWDSKKAAAWLLEIARKEQIKVDISTAEFFVELIGTEDSAKLYSELVRLKTISQEITTDLIEKQCEGKHDVFGFIKLLAMGKTSRASKELNKLIESKETNLGTLALIQNSLIRYIKVSEGLKLRLNDNQLAESTGISTQRLYYQKKEVSSMKLEHLQKLLDESLQQERNIKSGRHSLDKSLKLLVHF